MLNEVGEEEDWRAGEIEEVSNMGAVSSYEEEEEDSSSILGGGEKEKNWAGKAKDVDGYGCGYDGGQVNACLGKKIAASSWPSWPSWPSWGGVSSPPPPIIMDE